MFVRRSGGVERVSEVWTSWVEMECSSGIATRLFMCAFDST